MKHKTCTTKHAKGVQPSVAGNFTTTRTKSGWAFLQTLHGYACCDQNYRSYNRLTAIQMKFPSKILLNDTSAIKCYHDNHNNTLEIKQQSVF